MRFILAGLYLRSQTRGLAALRENTGIADTFGSVLTPIRAAVTRNNMAVRVGARLGPYDIISVLGAGGLLVTGLLSKERDRRNSAAEVVQALKRLVESVAARPARSRRQKVVGAAVVLVASLLSASGVLVGYYLDFRSTMRQRPPAEIQRLALDHGARVHPQYATEFEKAFSVTWARVPWSRGSWRSESSAAHQGLALLREPDGRVYFAGDYMTDMSSWMQGAFESAREVATALHRRALVRG
jgi:hypothetical protein